MLGSVVNKTAGNTPPDPGCLLLHAGLLLDFCSLNSGVGVLGMVELWLPNLNSGSTTYYIPEHQFVKWG